MQVAEKESMQLALAEDAARMRVAHDEEAASLRSAAVDLESIWHSEAAHEREKVSSHACDHTRGEVPEAV